MRTGSNEHITSRLGRHEQGTQKNKTHHDPKLNPLQKQCKSRQKEASWHAWYFLGVGGLALPAHSWHSTLKRGWIKKWCCSVSFKVAKKLLCECCLSHICEERKLPAHLCHVLWEVCKHDDSCSLFWIISPITNYSPCFWQHIIIRTSDGESGWTGDK